MKSLLCLVLLLAPSTVFATTYYVRTDGNDSNLGTSNSSGGAWRNVTKCASTIVAGDVCRVQAGTYTANVTETTSGTDGNTITYVGDGAAIIVGNFHVDANYVRVISIEVQANDAADAITIGGQTGVEIWHTTTSGFLDGGISQRGPSLPYESNTAGIIVGNTINGRYDTDGSWMIALNGPSNIASHNIMNRTGVDFYVAYGPNNRVYNSYANDPDPTPFDDAHTDFLQTGVCCGRTIGVEFLTQDGNFYVGNPPAAHQHYANLETTPDFSGNYLSRRNVVHHNGGGGQGVFAFASVYMAHDMYLDMQIDVADANENASMYINTTPDPQIKNSMFVNGWSTLTTNAPVHNVESGAISAYNLAWDTTRVAKMGYCCVFNASGTNIKTQEPLFANYAADNFFPTSSSPARNAAGPLATVVGSGTGTTITVATDGGGFFRGFNATISQYGGNVASGDVITIGTDVRRIASISGDDITLTQSLTYANGEGVYLGDNSVDNAIGALPYRASTTLTATYECNGSTCPVTPSDASMVRMVVCFADGLPVEVLIDSPYNCTDPSGTFSARVYKLFASVEPWIDAQEGDPPADSIPVSIRRLF